MEIITKNMCGNELRKVAALISRASELNMDVSGYGYADVNQSSGNVYLWLEDYSYTLFIGPSSETIWAVWSNPENGEEEFMEVMNSTDSFDLEQWVESLEAREG